MKAVLTRDGHLLLERAEEMKTQFCPKGVSVMRACGDWCPLFGEPYSVAVGGFTLHLCGGTKLLLSEVVDRRVK